MTTLKISDMVRRRPRTSRISVLLAAWLAIPGLVRPCAAAADGDAPADPAGQYRYVVSARVRPLLFWIRRDNVGDARIGLRRGTDRACEYELLIGSDPGRAPFQINRWGYLLERVSPDRLTLVGVMTESKGDSIDEAHAQVSTAGSKTIRFTAIRARAERGQVLAAVQRALLPANLTMRHADAVLALFPESAMPARAVSLPTGVSGGFLSTAAALIEDGLELYRRSGRPPARLQRQFMHGSTVHELVLSTSTSVAFHAGGRPWSALESEFEVRTDGRKVSHFRITYGTEPPFRGIPVRVVYRPKWWFEAELVIQPSGA